MPSAFQGINMASSALRAFQQALDVTGHNVSNVNTAGYSRQSIAFTQPEPTLFWSGRALSMGNGVGVSTISRIRDMFLEARRTTASADIGKFQASSGNLQQVQGLFQEPGGTGVASALDNFFNAWSSLASSPNDQTMRAQVQNAGQTLADKVRGAYADLNNMKNQQNLSITDTFNQIDSLTTQLAGLNKQIVSQTATGAEPNDLLDQRDQTLRQLSSLVDIHANVQPNGSVDVYMNERLLVDRAGAIPIPRTYDASTQTLSDPQGTYHVRSGQLSGLFQSVNTITGYQGQLDTLANTLRTQVNTIHASGTNALGNTGVNFFNNANPQTGATDFDLDPAIKASPNAIAAGASGNPGDGGLALSLSELRSSTIPALGNKSVGQYFSDLVGRVGSDVQYFKQGLDTQQAVATQIDNQVQATSGVSIDDEMSNMLRFQRSYEAAAKALTIFDQVTNDLIGMVQR